MILEISRAHIDDLAEPRLINLRARIVGAVNAVSGRRLVERVVFSDYSLLEQ